MPTLTVPTCPECGGPLCPRFASKYSPADAPQSLLAAMSATMRIFPVDFLNV
jgi:hypothetical protein